MDMRAGEEVEDLRLPTFPMPVTTPCSLNLLVKLGMGDTKTEVRK